MELWIIYYFSENLWIQIFVLIVFIFIYFDWDLFYLVHWFIIWADGPLSAKRQDWVEME